MNFHETLDNKDWLTVNYEKLLVLFPETFTHTANLALPPILFKLKLLGLDFRSDDDITQMLARLESRGVIVRHGDYLIKRGKSLC